jgi:hypothetical protein
VTVSVAMTISTLAAAAPANAACEPGVITAPAPSCLPPPPGAGRPGRPGPPGSDGPGPFVAIAFSPDNGSHGWANNEPSYQQAVDAAVANCTHFGGRQCQLAAWDNTGCAAIAVMAPATTPNGKWGQLSGRGAATLNEAQDAALNANGGGEILLSRCATGAEGQGT